MSQYTKDMLKAGLKPIIGALIAVTIIQFGGTNIYNLVLAVAISSSATTTALHEIANTFMRQGKTNQI